jgi:hypothetical protein
VGPMDRTDQTPSHPHRPGPFTGADALRELVRLLAKQAAREIVAQEGCRHAGPHGCTKDH